MAKSKLIVADPGSGKSTMYELSDDQFRVFRGLKIGSEVEGSTVGVEGNIKITGGSDGAGFPMRPDVQGGVKKHVLMTKGVGFRSKEKGLKRRKMVRGNTITEEIYQINSVLIAKPKKKAAAKKEKAKEAPEAEAKEVAPSEAKLPAESKAEETPDKAPKKEAKPTEEAPTEAPKPAEEKPKKAPKEKPPTPAEPQEASKKTD